MQGLIKPLIWIMDFCYMICKNYGLAIIIFTLVSKIIILPLSIWSHKNSIKMVKMQPEINYLKVRYFGDSGKIAEEQAKIYKKYKYNPFISVVPTVMQLYILMGIIEVIKIGMQNKAIDMSFLGFSLAIIPSKVGGWYLLAPFLAALAALILCLCQNWIHVLQHEQPIWSQVGMLVISVGLSLYLGFFVTTGVVVYWIFSNLFSVLQMVLLNLLISPKKNVDYEALEKSRAALKELEEIGKDRKKERRKEDVKREKQDYKRFFSIVNKHLVFYSENNGFYKYYAALIAFLLEKTNVTIHYITSDPDDNIFKMAEEEPRIKAYYIAEKKLITLMMKMDADMVVMTMPDLENYHIKRSYVRKDVEYIHVQHGMGSVNLTARKGALDHFDTLFCATKSRVQEIKAMEEVYQLKKKNLVECGFFLLDDMIEKYSKMDFSVEKSSNKTIVIAPSWQVDNIIDSCLESLIEVLDNKEYYIIVRPHPQHVRHNREKLEGLKKKYADNQMIEVQLDFSATDTIWKSDVLITDWSDIAFEYAFCTHRPVLFINTPMKVMNPDYKDINIVPINITVREILGKSVDLDQFNTILDIIDEFVDNKEQYEIKIEQFLYNEVFHVGNSAEEAGKYIINSLKERRSKKNEE